MKFPVLWLSFVRVWVGTGKVICLAWDLVSRSLVCKRCRKEKSLRSGNIRSKLTEFVVSLDRIVTVTPTLSLRRTLGNLKEHLKSERSTSLSTVLKNFNVSCTWGVFFYSFA